MNEWLAGSPVHRACMYQAACSNSSPCSRNINALHHIRVEIHSTSHAQSPLLSYSTMHNAQYHDQTILCREDSFMPLSAWHLHVAFSFSVNKDKVQLGHPGADPVGRLCPPPNWKQNLICCVYGTCTAHIMDMSNVHSTLDF